MPFGASETEIKKSYRKLALIHHPDKNLGCEKSEIRFKTIVSAYETLSNEERRKIYDLKFTNFYYQPKTKRTEQNKTYNYSENKNKSKYNVKYIFWIIAVLIFCIYIFSNNSKTKKPENKYEFEEEQTKDRPQSGEIEFNK